MSFIASKERPKPFNIFLEKEYGIRISKKESVLTEEMIKAMQGAWAEYKNKKDG